MAENTYVTIERAVQHCGVHPKTIQRAIREGRLPAQYPQPNRCEIAASDLDTFLPGHVQAETEQRLAALELHVQQLQQQIEML
jgi:predicted site-specific integrase-resolvase